MTFGIKPTRPEISYGYLALESATEKNPVAVKKFIENLTCLWLSLCFKKHLWNYGFYVSGRTYQGI